MAWRAYLGDTMTGLVDRPIDLPSFSWAVTISDCSLATNRDKGAGTEEWSGVTVPWTAIGESDPAARAAALSALRRCLALMWEPEGSPGRGVPVLWGAIGQRTDTWLDTSFSLDSAMTLLSKRLVVAEGAYGTGPGGTSPGTLRYEGLSYRGIVSEVVRQATSLKPGGALPIDLPRNYYRDNDPARGPLVRWRSHANLLFTNWLNYFVYQETPYKLEDIR